ncbi:MULTISPECIES: cell wall-active antibiotics response protein LiaF [Planococcus]|uniref:Cell wall-active antibiotics response LiaF-like C-terminal domain-containing protein n=2 Tax=Planococcus TaxID=1372 RepID=A0ABM5WU08_9BACL|nr:MULTISPECIES: cell wall-active antibiotics response protein LiaF [Planococcus]ALS77677.1 hypothetical protein AUO94_03025 [Planococcus kocurii]AQU80421.1 hypothetical protein AJGP001_14525 [Planococcus faecalis]KAA0958940.1 hypothetical protein FQ085_04270 [Planococcus sp. ANT_H30]MDJ0330280.1 cell wall-active antibiotics response protein LiaF [Planococcus sp. S3-L1]OHX54812.1 hypothetical protein BB777_05630 [Planococcus faecalis]
MQHFPTNRQAFFLLSALLLIFVEAAFFGNGSVFLILLGIGTLYYALRNTSKYRRSYFWIGAFLIGVSILSMWSLRLMIFGLAIYLLLRLWKGQAWLQTTPLQGSADTGLIQNKVMAAQSTPIESYEWKDIHVQGFIGDILVDTTHTVLPKKPSLISIRQGFGKVQVIVPYEVPVRVFYSTLLGEARFFNGDSQRILNTTIHAEDGYPADEGNRAELIVSVTTWMGDVEVIRR